MNVERVRALFAKRMEHPFEPRLAGVTGSYRFDVDDVGSFFVLVDDGTLTFSELVREADCVIRCGAEAFLRIAEGKQNLLTAAMQGLVEIRGDLSLAQKLHGILPGPERPSGEPAGAQP